MPPLRIRIVKRIPVQAGLGGGSSDAVAAMRALAALWRVKVADDTLVRIGSRLGADVPFFVNGGTTLGVERGDMLFPLQDMPRMWVVLVFPGFGVSTKDAFAWHDEVATTAPVRRGNNRGVAALFSTRELVNDLERPVATRHRAVARLRLALSRAGARHAAMSGSGSTVFGLFDDRRTAAAAAASLVKGRVRTLLTHTTSASEYRAAVRPRLVER
jgi:4-diphosphocytidyl-2-C-methyl-D-erythritol kinase